MVLAVNWPPQAGTINNHVKQQNLLCIPKDSYIKIDNIPTHNEHGGWLRTGGRGTLFLVIQTPETYTEDFNLLESKYSELKKIFNTNRFIIQLFNFKLSNSLEENI